MKKIDLFISPTAPTVRSGAAWLKPVNGGFALYILDGGWKPLVLVNDNNTPSEGDDIVQDLIGTAEDDKNANTINGAKAYADDITQASYAEVLGDPTDAASNMTLYGLKAYIDGQIAGLD